MVDVLKSHVQDVMNIVRIPGQIETIPTTNNEEITSSGARRFANERQQQTIVNRKRENEVSIILIDWQIKIYFK